MPAAMAKRKSRNTVIPIEPIVARIAQWLAEGKDVRITAMSRPNPDFPMVEIWEADQVEVVTKAGSICEKRGQAAPGGGVAVTSPDFHGKS